MSGWDWAAAVLLIGGVGPALLMASYGSPECRFVGLELASATGVLALLVMAEAADRTSYLLVPLVFVLLSFTGTLVFAHLPAPRRR